MATTRFFHKLSVPIKTFLSMGSPKRSGDKQEITIKFRIALNGNNIRSAPKFVQQGYEAVQGGADLWHTPRELDNVNVEIYNLAETKRANFHLPRLHLTNFSVEEMKNSEGDSSVMLKFETDYPWDKAVWEYLGDHYSTDVFTRYDSAQATLLDLEEEQDAPKEELDFTSTPEEADEEETEEEEESPDEEEDQPTA